METNYSKSEMKTIENNGGRGGGNWCYNFVCDFNATDNECRTSLYLAVANEHISIVQYLVDVNVLTFYFLTF